MDHRAFMAQRSLAEHSGRNLAAGVATKHHMIQACEELCNPYFAAPNDCPASAVKHLRQSRVYLAVWNSQTDEVAAAAPVIDPYPMNTRRGAASEFDTRSLLATLQGWVVEIGTLCVAGPYRNQPQVIRMLLSGLHAHVRRMHISHVIAVTRIPRCLGDNTLLAIMNCARESVPMPFLQVRPWITHPRIEPDGSKPVCLPAPIKIWLRLGGIIHPVPSWSASINTASFLMYMSVASPTAPGHNARPALRHFRLEAEELPGPSSLSIYSAK